MLFRCCLPLLLSLVSAASAQQIFIAPETPATPATLREWLHSGDPRLVAWAATLAHRDHAESVLPDMAALLQHLPPPAVLDRQDGQEWQRALLAILDTLIQEKADVRVEQIREIASTLPTEALLLVSRVPLTDSRALLKDWTYANTGGYWGSRTLARVASMWLIQSPDSDLVSTLSTAAETTLHVEVTKAGYGFGSGSSIGSCGDSMGTPLAAGWPAVFTYDVEENNAYSQGLPIVELDGDVIKAYRHQSNRGHGSCAGVDPLNAVTRHRLIAHLLAVPDRDMAWQADDHTSIQWSDQKGYEQELGKAVETQRERLRTTVDRLHQLGFPSASMPRLTVVIECRIDPCPLASN